MKKKSKKHVCWPDEQQPNSQKTTFIGDGSEKVIVKLELDLKCSYTQVKYESKIDNFSNDPEPDSDIIIIGKKDQKSDSANTPTTTVIMICATVVLIVTITIAMIVDPQNAKELAITITERIFEKLGK